MDTDGPVMCALEDTRVSREALAVAGWFAEALDTSLLVAHAFDPGDVPVRPGPEVVPASITDDDSEAAARLGAQRLLDRAAETLSNVEVHTEMPEGSPVPAVLEVASTHGATLLVTGTAARSGLDRVLIGSVSSELAARAPCPVVAVSRAPALGEPGPIVAGYDGSGHSVRAAHHAAGLATRMGRDLVLVHASGRGDDEVAVDPDLPRELYAYAAASSGEAKRRPDAFEIRVAVEEGDAAQVLANVGREQGAPLIVTGTRGRNLVTAGLLGSVTAEIVRTAGRPIGIVPTSAGDTPRARL